MQPALRKGAAHRSDHHRHARCRCTTSSRSRCAACWSCAAAALNLLIPNPRDIGGLIKELAQVRSSTCFPAVNTLYNALLNHPDFAKLDFSSLRRGQRRRHGGAGGRRPEVAGAHGLPHRRGLRPLGDLAGVHLQPDRHRRSPARSACRCRPPRSRSATTTASLCRSASPARSAIRGPQVMAGYWQRPDETAKVMTPDGFFKTGDIGVMDERGYTSRSSTARRT